MKNRIDNISNLNEKCTGCMACVDVCPKKCILSIEKKDGFRYSVIDTEKCINCGKCYSVCPIETHEKHTEQQSLFAAYATDTAHRNSGSSGGVFALLAEKFLQDGYYVCGAAFDGTILKHRIVDTPDKLTPLFKSKYLQSDTKGIYSEVLQILKGGDGVFFCGTPCQVSALINFLPSSLKEKLVTADIVCHGVPSQKVFNDYINSLEKKHAGKISDFSFRVKNNKYKHAHGYSYKVTKNNKSVVVNGIYTQSSFYNAFKNYIIFRNSCYDCQYATLERVSDITLADFWGIEKYNPKANIDAGISMVITNTAKGRSAYNCIEKYLNSEEFPLQCGIDSNYCLTHTTKKPKDRDMIIDSLSENGYEATADKYFKDSFIHKAYWLIPPFIRNCLRKLRSK